MDGHAGERRQRLLTRSGGFKFADAPEVGEGGGDLECLAQRIDALDGVVYTIIVLVDATESIVAQASKAGHTQRYRLKASDKR